MAEENFTVFGRTAGGTQSAREGVTQNVDPNQGQARFAACLLPTGFVHGVDAPAAIGRLPICKPGPELAAPFPRLARDSDYFFPQGLATGQPASQTRGSPYGLVRKSGLGQFVFDSERPARGCRRRP